MTCLARATGSCPDFDAACSCWACHAASETAPNPRADRESHSRREMGYATADVVGGKLIGTDSSIRREGGFRRGTHQYFFKHSSQTSGDRESGFGIRFQQMHFSIFELGVPLYTVNGIAPRQEGGVVRPKPIREKTVVPFRRRTPISRSDSGIDPPRGGFVLLMNDRLSNC